MARIRVFEAAKKHGCEVQELMDALTELGIKVRSHLSPVDAGEIQKALQTLGGSTEAAAEDTAESPSKPRTVVRRRRKPVEAEAAGDEEAAAETTMEEMAVGGAEEAPAEPPAEAAPTEEPATEADGAAAASGEEQAAVEAAETPEAEPEAAEESAPEGATEAEPEAEAKPAEDESGPRLKVVRFIHPPVEEPPPVSSPSYHMSKKEREGRRVEKKVRRKKGRREQTRSDKPRGTQKTQITVPKASKRKIRISEVITVSELSQRMGVKATELIKKLMALGVLATINQTIDSDTAALVASEFDYEVENIRMGEEEMLARAEDTPEQLELRPPVVTVMGHVDHGKTSLLDAIRETRVAAGEAGGITQHIGAYLVETEGGKVAFLDTPGHEAFTALRARGAKVTDITVLVVAADDGVMPQTVEAIDHSRAASVPIIVAINKMDKADANPDRVLRELSEHGLVAESWGGEVICVPVSAKQRTGIKELLEMLALQAEIMELQANPNKAARGIVVEARIDRGRGPVATVLVQEGTLSVGDIVLAGQHFGRIRALINDKGKQEKSARPSTPVELTGLNGVPGAGEPFVVVESERVAREIGGRRSDKAREEEMVKARKMSLADLHTRIAEGEVKDLPIIIKADVQGSVEALSQALEKLSNEEVRVKVIHGAVGGITENDVNLAAASDAIILGFNVRPEAKANALSDQIGVDIRLYNVIYEATDDVKKALEGLLAPTVEERVLGRAQVRQIFKVPKIGTVAGCFVTQGVVRRNARTRLLRDNVVIYDGELGSLKRFKDDVKEVREGFECGLSVENYNDLKEGDELEFYVLEEVKRSL